MQSATPIPKRYALLRSAITAHSLDQATLAKRINRSDAYVNKRLCGHKPWDEDDIYAIVKVLRLPVDELHLYFPPRGIPPKEKVMPAQQGPRRLVLAR